MGSRSFSAMSDSLWATTIISWNPVFRKTGFQLMIVVAQRLSDIALNERDPIHFDLFGRSAFNRFYYASYLITRDMLWRCDPTWAWTPHQEIPNLLKDCILKRIRKPIRNQSGKLISRHEGKLMAHGATAAIVPLAGLLASAYTVR